MSKYFIESARVGVSGGGMACGPVSGVVVGEVVTRDEAGKRVYHCLAEAEGCPNFYESEQSLFDGQVEDDFSDEFTALMESSYSGGWSDYRDFYDAVDDTPEMQLLKYLVYLVRADWDEIDRFKALTVGKYIGDFEIPLSDLEQEYLEDEAEDDDEDGEDGEE